MAPVKDLPGATGGQHSIEDVDDETAADLQPMSPHSYKGISDAKEALGSMMFMDEPHMREHLLQRGNKIEDIEEMHRDIILACRKFKVELSPNFENIAGRLGI